MQVKRAVVHRLTVLREIPLPEDSDIRFELDEAVFVEPGAIIWTEADELVVEHPGGETVRHHGQWSAGRYAYGHTGSEVAREVDSGGTSSDNKPAS